MKSADKPWKNAATLLASHRLSWWRSGLSAASPNDRSGPHRTALAGSTWGALTPASSSSRRRTPGAARRSGGWTSRGRLRRGGRRRADGVGPRGPGVAAAGRRAARAARRGPVAHRPDDAGRGRRHRARRRSTSSRGSPAGAAVPSGARSTWPPPSARASVETAIRGQRAGDRPDRRARCGRHRRSGSGSAAMSRWRRAASAARSSCASPTRPGRSCRGAPGRRPCGSSPPPGGTAAPFWQISGRAAPAPYCLDRTVQVDGPVRVLHVAGDAQKGVFEAAGFAGCKTWRRDASQTVPSSAAIEAAAAAELILPDGHGWIDLPAAAVGGDRPMRAWLGSDEHAAAAAHGSDLHGLRRRRAGRPVAPRQPRRSPGRDPAPADGDDRRLGRLAPDPQRGGPHPRVRTGPRTAAARPPRDGSAPDEPAPRPGRVLAVPRPAADRVPPTPDPTRSASRSSSSAGRRRGSSRACGSA